MEILKFKSNINCGGCIAKVTPLLNTINGLNSWEVDVNSPDKILTITGNVAENDIIEVVSKIGFRIQVIN